LKFISKEINNINSLKKISEKDIRIFFNEFVYQSEVVMGYELNEFNEKYIFVMFILWYVSEKEKFLLNFYEDLMPLLKEYKVWLVKRYIKGIENDVYKYVYKNVERYVLGYGLMRCLTKIVMYINNDKTII